MGKLMESGEELMDLAIELEEQLEIFEDKGVKVAAGRARKRLMAIINQAKQLRKDVQEAKNTM